MNYLEQVAHMLGVEYEEEFKIKGDNDNIYKITEYGNSGIKFKGINENSWFDTWTLLDLIVGKCEIVKTSFKPSLRQTYFHYDGEEAGSLRWLDDATDLALWKVGNCFRTKEEAETKGKEIFEKLREEYEGDC